AELTLHVIGDIRETQESTAADLHQEALTVNTMTISVPIIGAPPPPKPVNLRMRKAPPASRAPKAAGSHTANQTDWYEYGDVAVRWSGMPKLGFSQFEKTIVPAAFAAMIASAGLAASALISFFGLGL